MKTILSYAAAVLIVAAFFLFGGWFVMICWNYTMPYIFDLPVLGLWRAIALNVLTALLFKRIPNPRRSSTK